MWRHLLFTFISIERRLQNGSAHGKTYTVTLEEFPHPWREPGTRRRVPGETDRPFPGAGLLAPLLHFKPVAQVSVQMDES